ncbi:unnamed protein product [Vitrella brassicaformis CCMP3155]|uniref:Uncharacterized protein n=1 Tax=Vitrella brassicaformis (strain CCMP3155) TaxID=1169540 RepID=A0A0G4FXK4_VITBC|nr:unnamed protein product [Vitrella brassicaformis CCMP3155]|eukprot:CEM20139.1 unnamed protein product [Vitrella brassicaformis CCMP3155]
MSAVPMLAGAAARRASTKASYVFRCSPKGARGFATETAPAGGKPAIESAGKPQKIKPWAPESPLHFYQATKFATASINHRLFYVNWIFIIFLLDAGYVMIDA